VLKKDIFPWSLLVTIIFDQPHIQNKVRLVCRSNIPLHARTPTQSKTNVTLSNLT